MTPCLSCDRVSTERHPLCRVCVAPTCPDCGLLPSEDEAHAITCFADATADELREELSRPPKGTLADYARRDRLSQAFVVALTRAA